MTQPKILYQGAEAIIKLEGKEITKQRVSKSYRIPELDSKIIKLRTRSEAKILEKLKKIINVPNVIKTTDKEIIMEFIEGKRLSSHLDDFSEKEQEKICKEIGKQTSKMHETGIVHGDLTTSNMILKENKVYFIDFGLGFHSIKAEDKAVDLHLIKQALEAKHFKFWEKLWKAIQQGYESENKEQSKKILEQLKKVDLRGRYKH